MSFLVAPSRFATLVAIIVLSTTICIQSQNKKIGWPSQIVLVRDEITPAGSLGHLLVNGKDIAVTFEPKGEKAQITVSRAHIHHVVADSKEDFAVVLDDLDDGDSGNKLSFHLGDLEDKSDGCVLIGTGYKPTVVTADLTTEDGKKLLHEIDQEKGAGKAIQYEVDGSTLRLTSIVPINSADALLRLRRALYGNGPTRQDLLVNFDFRASDEYKAEALGISESIDRQLKIDERQFVIKAMEVPSEAPDGVARAGTKPEKPAAGDAKSPANTKLLPQKPGDERNSVEQGYKRSQEPDQPTTFDNKPTPPVQQTDKKKTPPPD